MRKVWSERWSQTGPQQVGAGGLRGDKERPAAAGGVGCHGRTDILPN